MAERPRGYGLTAEVNRKIAAKYDEGEEQQAVEWMEAVTGQPVCEGETPPLGPAKLQASLKDGIYLCKLMNTLQPGAIKKVNESKMAFKQMENIGHFLTALEAYGLSKTDIFQTVDLYENQNVWQVVCCIHALGRKAQSRGFAGPVLGPRESQSNVREFSDEQRKAGQGVIGLQMGSNKGASQSGMNFGNQRHIID